MGEVVFTILLFFGIIAVTVVLFGGWVILSVVRFILRAFGGAAAGAPKPMRARKQVLCPHHRCGAPNPADARFCRRCGHELPAVGNEFQYHRAAIL